MVYYPSFPAYQSATGWDVHSINKDPLFVNKAIHDYRLTLHSPCIDASDPSSAKKSDRPIADMGAFESTSAMKQSLFNAQHKAK